MKAREKHFTPAPSWAETNFDFIQWWRRHRDSGYVEDDEGKGRYNIYPHEAFSVLKYQAEYHGDCNLPWTNGKIEGVYLPEFTASDFENWAQRQKEFEDAGGNRPVSRKSARTIIENSLAKLSGFMPQGGK